MPEADSVFVPDAFAFDPANRRGCGRRLPRPLPGKLKTPGGDIEIDVHAVDVSSSGIGVTLLDGEQPIGVGERVEVAFDGGSFIPCVVRWREDDRLGLLAVAIAKDARAALWNLFSAGRPRR